ncbi:hypothetical protein CK203_020074 [Vitis vinifera]|uniref:Retrotransposon Copia-like N-terminal domain-containing protein n=1 Tax=Vitis vinifera TaxID=29760 RepID=A0A438J837_VITVI|nr:hypothetical protein CK203_020074 [Vitis vinifera]
MARGGSNANSNGNRMVISTSQSSTSDDSRSPLFLHNGDHLGLTLVPHQLTGSNYNTSTRAMIMALTAKNKLGFVDGIEVFLDLPPLILFLLCGIAAIVWSLLGS